MPNVFKKDGLKNLDIWKGKLKIISPTQIRIRILKKCDISNCN